MWQNPIIFSKKAVTHYLLRTLLHLSRYICYIYIIISVSQNFSYKNEKVLERFSIRVFFLLEFDIFFQVNRGRIIFWNFGSSRTMMNINCLIALSSVAVLTHSGCTFNLASEYQFVISKEFEFYGDVQIQHAKRPFHEWTLNIHSSDWWFHKKTPIFFLKNQTESCIQSEGPNLNSVLMLKVLERENL